MRVLNMNSVRHLHHSILKGKKVIGRGAFANVYADKIPSPEKDVETVVKVTADQFGYASLRDWPWLDHRKPVEAYYPRLVADHGDVGSCGKYTIYAVEVERLHPLRTSANRKFVRSLIADFNAFRLSEPDTPKDSQKQSLARRHNATSVRFCGIKAAEEGPYQALFESWEYFLSNWGGGLDLVKANFMERSDGHLVCNDIFFDVDGYEACQRC